MIKRKLVRTLNLNRQTTAILENAYAIGYDKEVNAIWQTSFSLPLNDPKVEKVKMLEYVEITDDDEYIGLFRIIPKHTTKSESTQEVTFECEHVLATLLDSSLFKYHQRSNFTTKDNIQYLLDNQNHKHWKLGKVEITRYFHYSWENENLLSALFSIPKPFDEQYEWTWDTQSYPWTLNLIKPDTEPVCRIKEGYNLVDFTIEENPMSVYNRIYPLGAGEGVNQLSIESVNNGVPYLEDRQEGEEIRETIWPDKRYEDAESLKTNAQALLDKWKKPIVTWQVTAADLSKITGLSIDKFKKGKVVRLQLNDYPTTDLRIMVESKPDIKGDPGNIQLDIGNVQEDLGTTQSDMERRQKVNEVYSQGATNIMNFTYQDNADGKIPATIPFYVDDDVININTIELSFETKPFRAYSRATEGGGALVDSTKGGGGVVKSTKGGGGTTRSTTSGGGSTQTSTSGGGTTATSSSGGGTSTSTKSGGGSTQTSSVSENWGNELYPLVTSNALPHNDTHRHTVTIEMDEFGHNHKVSVPAHSHNFETPNHTHNVSIPSHDHKVTIPNHSHDVTIPDHTHEIDLPNHTHEIELPDHTHEVKHEIIELDSTPRKVTIKVDGNTVDHDSASGNRINLVDYMAKDDSGKITRGKHEVTILPDGLARIEADLILRVFIQSQLGGKF